jgi:hypothetical protein
VVVVVVVVVVGDCRSTYRATRSVLVRNNIALALVSCVKHRREDAPRLPQLIASHKVQLLTL